MAYTRVEKSFPKYTRDGLHFLTFMSSALGSRGSVTIFIPPGHEETPNLPIVLLLHGVYGSDWAWAFNGGAHISALELLAKNETPPMALVMPSDGFHGEGSGYANHPGRACEAWIMEDVLSCVRGNYPCFSAASPLFIAGFSMGGFGAMRLGAKYPHLFRGIGGHASMTHWDQSERFAGVMPPGYLSEEDKSVLHWMKANRAELPPIRFDCGSDDILIEHNRKLHAQLTEEGIPHIYEEVPGRHSWEYCHEHVKDSLRFFAAQLKDTP